MEWALKDVNFLPSQFIRLLIEIAKGNSLKCADLLRLMFRINLGIHLSCVTEVKILALVLVAQSCPTLCDSMYCSPQGSSVHGILQARILEWVPGDLPDPGIKPRSPVFLADSLLSEPPGNISTSDSNNCVSCIYALNKFLVY